MTATIMGLYRVRGLELRAQGLGFGLAIQCLRSKGGALGIGMKRLRL